MRNISKRKSLIKDLLGHASILNSMLFENIKKGSIRRVKE